MKLENSLVLVLCALLAVVCGCGTDEPEASQGAVDVVTEQYADPETPDIVAEPRDDQETTYIAAAPNVDQEEMEIIANLLANQETTDVAARSLESALDRLPQTSELLVENTTFVTRVNGWGVYEPFSSTDFAPGTRVALYAEIKNFVSNETEKGHETKLRGSYEILAQHGGRILVEHDFGVVNDTCGNRRRDLYVRYIFNLPLDLNPGQYTLRLTINDLHSGEVGQEEVNFSISRTAKSR